MPAIETDGLTKRFGEDVLAVSDLDLVVETGEIFGFLGPNGAGKSTTINLLLDFIRPTAGSAQVLGMDAQARSTEIRDRVGVLPEGYGFDGSFTAREYAQWVIETKAADDDPEAVLDLVGIADAADRTVGGYSKGMQQRLAFGLALVGDPDLLVLDEPSSGLDPNGIQHMREVIRERAADGTTVFFSSHILSEVEAVCDRVGVMNEGELVAMDSIDGLRESVGGHAEIVLECATRPDGLDVESLPGVASATVDETTLTARCTPESKVDVVEHVADRVEVRDILAENASLEELFNTYTEGGRDSPDAAAADGAVTGEDAGDDVEADA